MKILFAFMGDVCGSGGMEHSCCNLANSMKLFGHEILIAQGYGTIGLPFFKLDKDIEIRSFFHRGDNVCYTSSDVGHCISPWRKIIREFLRPISISKMRQWNEYCRFKLLRPGIMSVLNEFQPDVIIAFSPDVAFYFLKCGFKIPVITRFSIRPSRILSKASKGEKWAVENSAAVQVLLPTAQEEILQFCPGAKPIYLPNPVPKTEAVDLSKDKKTYKIINVARLQKTQKRQHLLVQAFSMLSTKYPNWNLELWGDEQCYPDYTLALKRYIVKCGLQNRVSIKGKTHQVFNVLQSADLFVFPSAYEGFPNALAEAMSAGLPVVACNDCLEAASLIQNGYNGILAEGTVKSLYIQLDRLMSDRKLCDFLGKNAHKSMGKYSPDKVYGRWNHLLRNIVETRS